MKNYQLKKKLAGYLIIPVFLFALTACAQSQADSPKEVSVHWTEIEQGVELNVGDILEVVLPVKPSTGYQWEAAFYNQSVLKPYGESEFSSTDTNLGGEETQTLHMEAIGEGETELVLVYHRTFEENTDQQTYKINVGVK